MTHGSSKNTPVPPGVSEARRSVETLNRGREPVILEHDVVEMTPPSSFRVGADGFEGTMGEDLEGFREVSKASSYDGGGFSDDRELPLNLGYMCSLSEAINDAAGVPLLCKAVIVHLGNVVGLWLASHAIVSGTWANEVMPKGAFEEENLSGSDAPRQEEGGITSLQMRRSKGTLCCKPSRRELKLVRPSSMVCTGGPSKFRERSACGRYGCLPSGHSELGWIFAGRALHQEYSSDVKNLPLPWGKQQSPPPRAGAVRGSRFYDLMKYSMVKHLGLGVSSSVMLFESNEGERSSEPMHGPDRSRVVVKAFLGHRRPDHGKHSADDFHNEFSILSELNHKNVVQLLGWGTLQGQYNLILEHLAGYSLKDYIAMNATAFRRMPPLRLLLNQLSWSVQCVDSVAFLHKHQYIHRDLKPEHFLFRVPPSGDSPGELALVDFTFARRMKPHSYRAKRNPTDLEPTLMKWPGVSVINEEGDCGMCTDFDEESDDENLSSDEWEANVVWEAQKTFSDTRTRALNALRLLPAKVVKRDQHRLPMLEPAESEELRARRSKHWPNYSCGGPVGTIGYMAPEVFGCRDSKSQCPHACEGVPLSVHRGSSVSEAAVILMLVEESVEHSTGHSDTPAEVSFDDCSSCRGRDRDELSSDDCSSCRGRDRDFILKEQTRRLLERYCRCPLCVCQNGRADIWAIGLVLMEVFGGSNETGDTSMGDIKHHLCTQQQAPEVVMPLLDAVLSGVQAQLNHLCAILVPSSSSSSATASAYELLHSSTPLNHTRSQSSSGSAELGPAVPHHQSLHLLSSSQRRHIPSLPPLGLTSSFSMRQRSGSFQEVASSRNKRSLSPQGYGELLRLLHVWSGLSVHLRLVITGIVQNCLQIDPRLRPSAAEALTALRYLQEKVQQFYKQLMTLLQTESFD